MIGGSNTIPPRDGPNGTMERNAVPLGPRELSRKHVKGENTLERINRYNCNDLQTIIEDTFSQARRICEETTPNGREYLSSVYVHSVHDLRVVSHEEVRVLIDYSANVCSEFEDGDKDEPVHWCQCADCSSSVSGTEEVVVFFADGYEPIEVYAFGESFPC